MTHKYIRMRSQKVLSINDREHLKFFVREFIHSNIIHNARDECWAYASPRFGEYLSKMNNDHIRDVRTVRRKFGTILVREILWMFVNRKPIGKKFAIPCPEIAWCVNPTHIMMVDPKLNSLYPVPVDGELSLREFCQKFVLPWIKKDLDEHWIFRSPLTHMPVRLYPKELKVSKYAERDIQDMLWEWQTGKKLYSASNYCSASAPGNYYCINPDHFTGATRFIEK